MDLNELAQIITREILRQINEETKKDCIKVVGKRSSELIEICEKKLGGNVEIVFSDDSAENKTFARYIVPVISCSSMAELAAGMATNPLTGEILKLLLTGTLVETFEFEYKNFIETAPEALCRLYESYEETLSQYGLKQFEEVLSNTLRLRTNLVTEKDVFMAQEKGASVLFIPEKANITPLAADSARDLNVRLLKQ
jgi:ethanolamine utilization protein